MISLFVLFFFFCYYFIFFFFFFFSSRRRHTRSKRDWSSDVCSSDLPDGGEFFFDEVEGFFPGDLYEGVVFAEEGFDEAVFGVDVTPGELALDARSEERRVGKECRCWWAQYD